MANNKNSPRNLFETLFGRQAYNRLTEALTIPENVRDTANRAYDTLAYLFASPTPKEIERTAYGLTAPLRTAFQPPSERVYQVAEIASKPFEALAKGLSPAMEKVAKTLASTFQGETKTAIPTAKTEEVPASTPPTPAKSPANLIDWEALSRLFRDRRATPAGIKLVLSTILDAFRLLGTIQRRTPFEAIAEAYEPLITLQKNYLSALEETTNPETKKVLLEKISNIERLLSPYYSYAHAIAQAYGLPSVGMSVEGTPSVTALPVIPPETIGESPFAKHLSKYLGER